MKVTCCVILSGFQKHSKQCKYLCMLNGPKCVVHFIDFPKMMSFTAIKRIQISHFTGNDITVRSRLPMQQIATSSLTRFGFFFFSDRKSLAVVDSVWIQGINYMTFMIFSRVINDYVTVQFTIIVSLRACSCDKLHLLLYCSMNNYLGLSFYESDRKGAW